MTDAIESLRRRAAARKGKPGYHALLERLRIAVHAVLAKGPGPIDQNQRRISAPRDRSGQSPIAGS